MMIGKVLHWLYCLDFADAIILLLACSILFCLVKKLLGRSCWWQLLVTFLLLVASAGVIYTTLGPRTSGGSWQINLIPLHSYREVIDSGNIEILRSNFMNAMLFYPIGLLATALLPERWVDWSRCVLVVLLCGLMSVGIECMQYTHVLGRCEIDDVIHNMVGALTGSLASLLMPSLIEWLLGKVKPVWTRCNCKKK